jgi:hypothetical protein
MGEFCMSVLNNRITAVLAGSALVVGLGATGAVAGDMIGSGDIRDGSIRGVDLRDGVNHRISDKATDGQVNGLEGRVSLLEENPAVSEYTVFTHEQDFGPGGIGGAWCGAPAANAEDEGWKVIGGGAEFTDEDVNRGVALVSSWPNLTDPKNPGWNVQVNKPANVNPGVVTLYAVCVKTAE